MNTAIPELKLADERPKVAYNEAIKNLRIMIRCTKTLDDEQITFITKTNISQGYDRTIRTLLNFMTEEQVVVVRDFVLIACQRYRDLMRACTEQMERDARNEVII